MFQTSNFYKKFIVFEGIEGSGKSTNLNFIADLLKQKGVTVTLTREPGGTPMGEEIRNILLAHREEKVTPMTELLLLFAARKQHIENIINPALDAGNCVLSDRFTDASYSYQGGGRKVLFKEIEFLENLVQKDLRPDLTIIFDIPVEHSIKRIKYRKNIDRIEREKIEFFNRVRQSYLDLANNSPERYKVIDAAKPLLEVQKELKEIFNNIFSE